MINIWPSTANMCILINRQLIKDMQGDNIWVLFCTPVLYYVDIFLKRGFARYNATHVFFFFFIRDKF